MVFSVKMRPQAALWPVLLLLGACGHDAPTERNPGRGASATTKTTATPAAGETTAPTAGEVAKISQINVFVDMSGGMQGFVHPVEAGATGSGFQQTVTELLSDVNAQRSRQAAPPAYYFFKEKTAADPRLLVPSTYADMTGTISGGLKHAARGSELPEMLREALKRQAQYPGTVSLLISDFIFAPREKGETWKIKTFIKDVLSEVEASKLAVSVFANTSDYRGNFYPGNRTGPQPLNGEKVPYYIWVLGSPALVAQADAGLLHRLAAQPQAHYNVRFAPPYAVLDFFDPAGSWMLPDAAPGAAPTVVFTRQPTPGAPAEVTVGLRLGQLPPSVVAGLNAKALRLADGTATATLLRVWPLAQEPSAAATPALGQYTHFARLRFVQAPAVRKTLALELARPAPAWVAGYSTASDSNIKGQGAKTFHLEEVLAGVDSYFAEEASAQRVFSLPVQVESRE